MSFAKYTQLPIKETLEEFDTSKERGLASQQVITNLQKYGLNTLEKNAVTWLQVFFRQFRSAFTYILVIAMIISFLFGEILDGSMILLFLTLNIFLGFHQEYKSEKAVRLLSKYIEKKATVTRNGKEETINAQDIVPGDLIFIEAGDIIPADIRIIDAHDLFVDESTLTGESIWVPKNAKVLLSKETEVYKARNIGFMGTNVVEGSAHGVVINTGMNTEIGRIGSLTSSIQQESGFEKQINKFSKFVLYLTLITILLVFIVQLSLKRDTINIPDLIVFSLALAVGIIPEALPVVATFSLSHGALKLAKKKVVVKRLSSIEDLGSIDVLCSDKTGTLTENKLTVAEVCSESPTKLLQFALLANGSSVASSSFDIALQQKLHLDGGDVVPFGECLSEEPFDPQRKRSSALVKTHSEHNLIVRGAYEAIIDYAVGLSETDKNKFNTWSIAQGIKGRRVLAVAYRKFSDKTHYSIKDEEFGLTFLGLISFEDPIKKSTLEAVKKAKHLGVTIKVLTGDSAAVAGAVAYEAGLCKSPHEVLTGALFEAMPPLEQIKAVETYNVFARVSPEQKYNIIKLLKLKNDVGYLGDGINDAPALKLASVSIVVAGASDIAREVADIILLDKSLHVIINGIEEGRKTFVNTAKYIKTTMASNFGNFYSMAFVSLLIDYLPMLPIQVLLVNLLSDFPMISIAADTVEPAELKRPKSYDIKEITLVATLFGIVSSVFDFMFFGIFYKSGMEYMRTYWFIGSILTELILIFSIRTKTLFYKTTKMPSPILIGLASLSALVTVTIPFTSWGRSIFRFIVPTLGSTLIISVLVLLYFTVTEFVKYLYYHQLTHNTDSHGQPL